MRSMPSFSLAAWRIRASRALDQIEAAHAAVGGAAAGKRYAAQQITQAYAVLLSSQFQRFCRDLHSEAADHLTSPVAPAALRDVLHVQLTAGRKLDTGNPNPGNLGSDFARFGMQFWMEVLALDQRNRE